MSCGSEVSTLLPFYVAGTLDEGERRQVDEHLAVCDECRQELALWQQMGQVVVAEDAELPAPMALVVERALAQAQRRRSNPLRQAWLLIQYQIPLMRHDIWIASAIVMALGFLVALVSSTVEVSTGVIQVVAPLVAVAGVAVIYGADNDPSLELAMATPTSPRQVLLARLAIVFGYDLVLALMATVGLVAVVPVDLVGSIILSWLGPMAFLSALALVLSLCIGTSNAVAVAALLWFGRWIAGGVIGQSIQVTAGVHMESIAYVYKSAWDNPALLLGLAAVLVVVALWTVSRQERFLPQEG